MIFFQNLLDIAAYNVAVVLFSVNPDFDNGKPQRRRLFLERLAVDMIAQSCLKPEAVQTSINARATTPS